MRLSRSSVLGLCAAAALAFFGGCAQHGSYRVVWDFRADTSPGAPEQNAAEGCGQHGVDAIWVTATDTNADGDEVFAICTPGQVTRSVPTGNWTLQVRAIDAGRAFMTSVAPEMPIPVVVVGDDTTTEVAVTLTVPPACDDGVDNDGDGRIDLADPECAGDPGGPHE